MKWRPHPLLCLFVFVAGCLSSLVFGWWFLAGLCLGWASLLALALFAHLYPEDEGGAE